MTIGALGTVAQRRRRAAREAARLARQGEPPTAEQLERDFLARLDVRDLLAGRDPSRVRRPRLDDAPPVAPVAKLRELVALRLAGALPLPELAPLPRLAGDVGPELPPGFALRFDREAGYVLAPPVPAPRMRVEARSGGRAAAGAENGARAAVGAAAAPDGRVPGARPRARRGPQARRSETQGGSSTPPLLPSLQDNDLAEGGSKWLRRRRDQLKRAAARLVPDDCATRWCGRGVHGVGADFYARPRKGGGDRTSVEGLITCKQLWSCPECQAAIMRARAQDVRAVVNVHRLTHLYRRAMLSLADAAKAQPGIAGPLPLGEVEQAVTGWALAHLDDAHAIATQWAPAGAAFPVVAGDVPRALIDALQGGVSMLTLTFPHWRGQRLAKLRRVLMDAWGRVTNGSRGWDKLAERMGLAGFVRALEVTVGERNGWHPHVHAVLLTDDAWTEAQRHELEVALFRRWCAALAYLGHEAPTWEHGIHLAPCHREEYVAKLGLADELMRQDAKSGRGGNRSPMQLLGDYADTGDRTAARLWREYAGAMKGARCIEWSRGRRDVRARYGFGSDPTDEQVAETVEQLEREDREKVHVAHVPAPLWAVVSCAAFNARTLLCEANDEGGAEALNAELQRLFAIGWKRRRHLYEQRARELREEWGEEAADRAAEGEWPPDVLARVSSLLRSRTKPVD